MDAWTTRFKRVEDAWTINRLEVAACNLDSDDCDFGIPLDYRSRVFTSIAKVRCPPSPTLSRSTPCGRHGRACSETACSIGRQRWLQDTNPWTSSSVSLRLPKTSDTIMYCFRIRELRTIISELTKQPWHLASTYVQRQRFDIECFTFKFSPLQSPTMWSMKLLDSKHDFKAHWSRRVSQERIPDWVWNIEHARIYEERQTWDSWESYAIYRVWSWDECMQGSSTTCYRYDLWSEVSLRTLARTGQEIASIDLKSWEQSIFIMFDHVERHYAPWLRQRLQNLSKSY